MKQKGDVVRISGKEYILGKQIGGGMEGSVFDVEGLSGYVIKMVNSSRKSQEECCEIRNHFIWLRDSVGKNDLLKNRLAAPKALLDDDLGYIMPKAKPEEYVSLKTFFDHPNDPDEFYEWCKAEYGLKKRIQIITDIFNSLERIHIAGCIFTDLSPNNIMVSREKNSIVFIDTDNMRKRSDCFVNVLGTEGYMAPELYMKVDDKTLEKATELRVDRDIFENTAKISADADVFSAAIIAFQLLTLQHPFVGDIVEEGSAELETRAFKCETEYVLKEGTENTSSQPLIEYFDNCSIITKELKILFARTFINGHDNPYLRPTAREFFEAFARAYDSIIKCQNCGVEMIVECQKTPEDIHCWFCEDEVSNQVVLKISAHFGDLKPEDVALMISDYENKSEKVENTGESFYQMSSITLPEGEDKFIYLRHFESSMKRSTPYAVIKLLDVNTRTILFSYIDDKKIFESYLLDKSKHTRQQINRGKEFSADRFVIVFGTPSTTRAGNMVIVGEFCSSNNCGNISGILSRPVKNNTKTKKTIESASIDNGYIKKVIELADTYKWNPDGLSNSATFKMAVEIMLIDLADSYPEESEYIRSLLPNYVDALEYVKRKLLT